MRATLPCRAPTVDGLTAGVNAPGGGVAFRVMNPWLVKTGRTPPVRRLDHACIGRIVRRIWGVCWA